jgi:pimeloyl-ACP methyl ester carboxylesterase
VARGIAFDDRFAAAVCDGGIWDLHERAFLRDRVAPADIGMGPVPIVSRVARNIKCPVLISTGERGWLKPERVRELYDELKAYHRDVTLKIFTSEETAAAEGHADNTTLANEFIFDWIASRLGIATN